MTEMPFPLTFVSLITSGYERQLISIRASDHVFESRRCPIQLRRDLSSRDSLLSCSPPAVAYAVRSIGRLHHRGTTIRRAAERWIGNRNER